MIISALILNYNFKNSIKIFKRDRFNHKSPNSAQTEAVCAGALDVELAAQSDLLDFASGHRGGGHDENLGNTDVVEVERGVG